MTDGYYDAPAYCALCDRPIQTGPLCTLCEHDDEDAEDDQDDEHDPEVLALSYINGDLAHVHDLIATHPQPIGQAFLVHEAIAQFNQQSANRFARYYMERVR